MNFLSQIMGRAKPTSVNIARSLAEAGADLEANRQQLAAAEEALQRVAVLTPAEHAAAEAEQAESRRAIVRAEARIAELQKGLVEAQETERLADLKVRADVARRRVEVEASKLLDRYDALGAEAAAVVNAFEAINAEVEAINVELQKVGLEPIETAESRYRREPDQVIPEVRATRKKWVRRVVAFDGQTRDDGKKGVATRLEDISVFSIVDGKHVPSEAGAFEMEVEDVTPARTIQGRLLGRLAGSVRLPPARIGSVCHWPKVEG
ncbi:hypothetical protein [Microvirga thermotolerans]|uniref:Uncharacterized protein n=1 Tax=Microvirga thermotolerans TaxID=2651334 RepID=A0A5P9JWS5_9HYPH|nr:hypothetical protein [Microvirga thermotolerans]QFU16571.1 hypothetical protein GDR74_10215 [Microvirga thermotolerans]